MDEKAEVAAGFGRAWRSMNTWRGAVVIVVSGLVGSVAMIAWLFLCLPRWEAFGEALGAESADMVYLLSLLEGLGLMLGSIFTSGRVTAFLLIGRSAEKEIAASGRWRLVPLQFATGALLAFARWAVAGWENLWTVDHVLQFAFGLVLMGSAVREAWAHWIAPRIAKRHR